MERKSFLKCSCSMGVASCLGFGLSKSEKLLAEVKPDNEEDKKTPLVPVDSRQLQNLLCYIDETMDEATKKNIFEKLGYEHTTSPLFIQWINSSKNNLQDFFDHINSNKDTYWEKIEYNPETSTIKITGKVVDRCVCPYASPENPPKSLCYHCCLHFQKCMFEMLLDKKVEVKVDEAFLLGGNRCSTTIVVDGKLPLGKI